MSFFQIALRAPIKQSRRIMPSRPVELCPFARASALRKIEIRKKAIMDIAVMMILDVFFILVNITVR